MHLCLSRQSKCSTTVRKFDRYGRLKPVKAEGIGGRKAFGTCFKRLSCHSCFSLGPAFDCRAAVSLRRLDSQDALRQRLQVQLR